MALRRLSHDIASTGPTIRMTSSRFDATVRPRKPRVVSDVKVASPETTSDRRIPRSVFFLFFAKYVVMIIVMLSEQLHKEDIFYVY
jgi:hypothetical protein